MPCPYPQSICQVVDLNRYNPAILEQSFMALGQLVNGVWQKDWTERSENGQFQRMPTLFHDRITADGSSGFKAEPDRYHLYISLGCPWAHRTALLWQLKGLAGIVGLSIVDPV